MHWIYFIHKFHNLSWITEINELFHDILIYWDAPVVKVEGIMNSSNYQSILAQNLQAFARKLKMKRNFQHNTNPKHTSKSTKEWLHQKKIKFWNSPARAQTWIWLKICGWSEEGCAQEMPSQSDRFGAFLQRRVDKYALISTVTVSYIGYWTIFDFICFVFLVIISVHIGYLIVRHLIFSILTLFYYCSNLMVSQFIFKSNKM